MRTFFLSVYVWSGEHVGVLQKNGNTIQANPKAQMSNPHTGPVLGCSWNGGGNKIYTVSADKTGASILYTSDGRNVQVRTHSRDKEYTFTHSYSASTYLYFTHLFFGVLRVEGKFRCVVSEKKREISSK